MTKVDGKQELLTAAEQWLDIPGFDGMYQASDLGRIRSTRSKTQWSRWKNYAGQVLKQNGRRYLQVSLQRDATERNYHVHGLVALAFHGECPAGMQVCHGDGNRLNNAATNLRYDSVAANHGDKRKHGTVLSGHRHPNSRLTEEGEALIVVEAGSISAIARKYGVSRDLVRSIKQRAREAA